MSGKNSDPLGRLKVFGLQHPWQAGLFLPVGFDDFRKPLDRFSDYAGEAGGRACFRCTLERHEQRSDKGLPRLVGYVSDAAGARAGFVAFSDIKKLQEDFAENGPSVLLKGVVSYLDGRMWIKSPEVVRSAWAGRVRPQYLSKPRVITPGTALAKMMECLRGDSVPTLILWLEITLQLTEREILAFAQTDCDTLTALFRNAHFPPSPEEGIKAQEAIERIAALGVVRKSLRSMAEQRQAKEFAPVEPLLRSVPFVLTQEQIDAVQGIRKALAAGVPQVMLSGDVGTGKTVVYGAVVASALQSGMSVACLLPNQALATQIHRELTAYWPQFDAMLVSGETPEAIDLTKIPLLIGTSALLFRDVGHRDLVVVDEQQKFARQQREQLLGRHSMLIEATATCVPRTQALVQFGNVPVFRLRKCHVQKHIRTRIWSESDRRDLFVQTRQTLATGGRVLVVYPKREMDDEGDGPDEFQLPSAEEAFEQWNRAFPGRVRLAHGAMSDQEKLGAIDDLSQGRADILVATSLVEVGITIPSLKRVIIVHAERFGLSTLHQIRGRVARDGGEGFCDLYLPRRVKEASFDRLLVMTRTADGFEIAQEDMRQRGFGDLSEGSLKQTGADEIFLFGRHLSMRALEDVLELLDAKEGGVMRMTPEEVDLNDG